MCSKVILLLAVLLAVITKTTGELKASFVEENEEVERRDVDCGLQFGGDFTTSGRGTLVGGGYVQAALDSRYLTVTMAYHGDGPSAYIHIHEDDGDSYPKFAFLPSEVGAVEHSFVAKVGPLSEHYREIITSGRAFVNIHTEHGTARADLTPITDDVVYLKGKFEATSEGTGRGCVQATLTGNNLSLKNWYYGTTDGTTNILLKRDTGATLAYMTSILGARSARKSEDSFIQYAFSDSDVTALATGGGQVHVLTSDSDTTRTELIASLAVVDRSNSRCRSAIKETLHVD